MCAATFVFGVDQFWEDVWAWLQGGGALIHNVLPIHIRIVHVSESIITVERIFWDWLQGKGALINNLMRSHCAEVGKGRGNSTAPDPWFFTADLQLQDVPGEQAVFRKSM